MSDKPFAVFALKSRSSCCSADGNSETDTPCRLALSEDGDSIVFNIEDDHDKFGWEQYDDPLYFPQELIPQLIKALTKFHKMRSMK